MRRQRRAVWRELFDALPDLALLGRILVASAVFGDDRISLFAVTSASTGGPAALRRVFRSWRRCVRMQDGRGLRINRWPFVQQGHQPLVEPTSRWA